VLTAPAAGFFVAGEVDQQAAVAEAAAADVAVEPSGTAARSADADVAAAGADLDAVADAFRGDSFAG